MLKAIVENDGTYAVIEQWKKKIEYLKLDEQDYKRVSGGPGLYALVNEYEFDWEALGVKPFSPEIRILGRNPENPDGYFIKLHRMFGIVVVLKDDAKIWVNQKFVCCERAKLIGYNMPESAMSGPPR
jgi:hypothetical protein